MRLGLTYAVRGSRRSFLGQVTRSKRHVHMQRETISCSHEAHDRFAQVLDGPMMVASE